MDIIAQHTPQIEKKTSLAYYSGQTAKLKIPDDDAAKTRREITLTVNRMMARMLHLAGLDNKSADTIRAIIASNPKPGADAFTPFRASLAAIGGKLSLGNGEHKASAEKAAQRRSARLFKAVQPQVNFQFVQRRSARRDGDPHVYIDYLTPAADAAFQAFETEGRSGEDWQRSLEIPNPRLRAEHMAEIFDRYALAGLNTIPHCNAQLVTPDGETWDYCSAEQAAAFCALPENEGWNWTAVVNSATSESGLPIPLGDFEGESILGIVKRAKAMARVIIEDYGNPSEAIYSLREIARSLSAEIESIRKTSQVVLAGTSSAKENHLLSPPKSQTDPGETAAGGGLPEGQILSHGLKSETQQRGQNVPSPAEREPGKASEPNDLLESPENELPELLRGNPRFVWALEYASRGWRVMPAYHTAKGVCSCKAGINCESPGKHPKGGVYQATTDRARLVREWLRDPHANVAIAAGEGFGVVLDFDGESGRALYGEWIRSGFVPETLEAITRSGGIHLVIEHFPGLKNGVKPCDKRGNPLPFDIRTDGGLIIVEPSRIGDGFYHWNSYSTPIAAASDELKSFLLGVAGKDQLTEGQSANTPQPSQALTGEAIECEPSADLGDQSHFRKDYRPGIRNRAFFEVACALRGKQGASREVILQELRFRNAKIQTNPYPDSELQKTVDWVCKKYRPEIRKAVAA